MSEDKYVLPTPDFPKMEMPESPKANRPEGAPIMGCEGQINETAVYDGVSPVLPPDDGRPRIMIGIPVLTFSYEFVISFLKFWTALCNMPDVNGKKPYQVGYHFVHRKPVHMAELELVKIAKWNKCTHILLMDDDIYDVTVEDLKKLVEADKPVVGGVMYASGFPYSMCVFRRYDTTKKVIDMPTDNSMFRLYEVPCTCNKCGFGMSHWDAIYCPMCGHENNNILQKADLIPFPFTLIKMDVFDKLKRPWFHCTDGYPTDSWFCDRCHEAGIPVYAHMGVRLNHRGITDVTRPYMIERDMAEKKATNNGGLVNITPEEMSKHQYLMHRKMIEAEDKCKPLVNFGVTGKGEQDVTEKSSVVKDVRLEESVKVPS